MNTTSSIFDNIYKDFYSNLEVIVRKVVAEELRHYMNNLTETSERENEFLTSIQASKYLGRKLSTLYKDVQLGNIPFHRSGARKLLFSKKTLEEFVKNYKVKDHNSINVEVSEYIISKHQIKSKSWKS